MQCYVTVHDNCNSTNQSCIDSVCFKYLYKIFYSASSKKIQNYNGYYGIDSFVIYSKESIENFDTNLRWHTNAVTVDYFCYNKLLIFVNASISSCLSSFNDSVTNISIQKIRTKFSQAQKRSSFLSVNPKNIIYLQMLFRNDLVIIAVK